MGAYQVLLCWLSEVQSQAKECVSRHCLVIFIANLNWRSTRGTFGYLVMPMSKQLIDSLLMDRLAQVTHLRLSNGYVPHTLSWPSSGAAWKLQELEIDVMIRHQSWLNSLFSKSAQLTSLMLQIRTYPKQNLYLEWQLPPGLR